MTDVRLIKLSPEDNVFLCVKTLEAGDRIQIEGDAFIIPERLTLGHKIAAKKILLNEKIIKFKAPIGSSTRVIEKGEWIHLHNMKSDYLPTYTRDDQGKFYEHS